MKDFYLQQSIVVFFILCQIAYICCMCPPSTIQGMDSNTCYKPSKIPKSFNDAAADCIEHKQGHLASILSVFENSFVLGLLNDYYNDQGFYWIGGYQTGTTWNWTDKSPFVYTNWEKGEPSINGSCLSINSDSNSGKWSSLNCDVKQNYFCKIKSTNDNFSTKTPEILTTSKPLIVNDCESGWTFYNVTNMCYKVSIAFLKLLFAFFLSVFHKQNCSTAELTCIQNGGHLASIHNEEVNFFLSEFSRTGIEQNPGAANWATVQVLIGLMDPTGNGDFNWTDGSAYDYNNWCPGSPYLPPTCTGLIADISPGIEVETIQGHENACYKLSTTPKNFFDAETDCESSNGYLTSVVNGFENSLISKIARDYLSTQKQFWIGGKKISSAWTWTDGTPFTYTNWAAGQPDSSDQCISVTSFNSQWSSIDCNTAQYYICKIQATVDNGSITTCPTNKPVIPDTTIRPITINDCESGWTYYNITNLCYKVFHGQTCYESETTCVQNGGHLASIHSLEENLFISQLAQAGYTFGNDGAWDRYHVLIGLMDPTLNGNFYWTDGSPYDYQRWGTCNGQPYLPDGCTTLIADQDTGGCFQEWITSYEETIHRAFVCQKSSIAHICQN